MSDAEWISELEEQCRGERAALLAERVAHEERFRKLESKLFAEEAAHEETRRRLEAAERKWEEETSAETKAAQGRAEAAEAALEQARRELAEAQGLATNLRAEVENLRLLLRGIDPSDPSRPASEPAKPVWGLSENVRILPKPAPPASVAEQAQLCKARIWDNGDMTDCGRPLPCVLHGQPAKPSEGDRDA